MSDPNETAPHLSVMTRRLTFRCLSWRGAIAQRTVEPTDIWFGSTERHPEQQWLMRACDLEKGEMRDFALKDMTDVRYAD